MDVPVDLSRVLFMCTANVVDSIPGPLLDRMEVIRLSGYIEQEKMSIARKYLELEIQDTSGVPDGSVFVEDDAMQALIRVGQFGSSHLPSIIITANVDLLFLGYD